MNKEITIRRKTSLCAALAVAMGSTAALLAGPASATIYTFSFGPGSAPIDTSDPRANDALFTILDPDGNALPNTSKPYYYDATWGYGFRTQITGTLTFDTSSYSGSASIQPLGIFSFNPFLPHAFRNASFSAAGTDPGTGHQLVQADMVWDWNGNNNIPVSLIWDVSGLLSAIDGGLSVGDVISGSGALPASDGIIAGKFPVGPAPIATATYDSAFPLSGDGIGGIPMTTGPFPGFNVNLDFASLTVTSVVPLPPALWLFGSGLLGLVSLTRRGRRKTE